MPHSIKTVELYNGHRKIDFHFDPENPRIHYYTKHGDKKRLPGVTTITAMMAKPQLIQWAADQAASVLERNVDQKITETLINEARYQHRNTKEQAADSGKAVHKWCEEHIKGLNPDMPTDSKILNGVTAFLEWKLEHGVEFVSSERIIFSQKYKYCGQMDAEAIIDGKRCVIDFKTSSGFYNDMRYQVAAYQMAAMEEGTTYEDERIIVRFDKQTGQFEVKRLDNLAKDFKAFLSLFQVYKRERELSKKTK